MLKKADTQRLSSTHPSLVYYCTHCKATVTALADLHCPVPSVNNWPLDPILIFEHLSV